MLHNWAGYLEYLVTCGFHYSNTRRCTNNIDTFSFQNWDVPLFLMRYTREVRFYGLIGSGGKEYADVLDDSPADGLVAAVGDLVRVLRQRGASAGQPGEQQSVELDRRGGVLVAEVVDAHCA